MNLKCFILILRDYIFIIPGTGMKQLVLEGEKGLLIVFWESPYFLLITQASVYLVPSISRAHL